MGRRDQPSVGAVERLRHGGLSRPSQLSPWIISDVACANPGVAGGHTHTAKVSGHRHSSQWAHFTCMIQVALSKHTRLHSSIASSSSRAPFLNPLCRSTRVGAKWLWCNEWLYPDSIWECNVLETPHPHPLVLRAPAHPAASQPRDQLQSLMKRQSGNWSSGGGGPAEQSAPRGWWHWDLSGYRDHPPPHSPPPPPPPPPWPSPAVKHHQISFRGQRGGKHCIYADMPSNLPPNLRVGAGAEVSSDKQGGESRMEIFNQPSGGGGCSAGSSDGVRG